MKVKILSLTYLVVTTAIFSGSFASANSASPQAQPSATEKPATVDKSKIIKGRNPQTGKAIKGKSIKASGDNFGKELGARFGVR